MKDQIHICSWLLTRRCNLKCSYCRISRDPATKMYPTIADYNKEEMDTKTVLSGLYDLKKHNPNMFHIFYGGEPFLRKDLYKIIGFCNDSNIHYTIITNNTEEIQPLIKKLFEKVEYVSGLTSSVDPLLYSKTKSTDDRVKKTHAGFKRLVEMKKYVKDLVAEITVSNDNVKYLYHLVKDLTDEGISSDITFVDIAKNDFYDFSNVIDEKQLVQKSDKLYDNLCRIYEEKLNVHLDKNFMLAIYNILPAELDCKLEEGIHNLTIDADGSIRLCLRIRGIETPQRFTLHNLFDINYFNESRTLDKTLRHYQSIDKINLCKGCNWTCIIMSQMIKDSLIITDELIHKDIRKGK
jgi:MoaA/NifB/PqqE/SkfB family radical SAM enzyme